MRKIYEDAIATEGSSESFKTAHRNFLVFRDRHQTYPDEDTALGFDAFIVNKYVGSLDRVSSRQAQGMIEGMAAQSFLSYAMGDEERYAGFERQGRLIWKTYRGQFKTDDHWNRMKIPPYPDLRRRAPGGKETIGRLVRGVAAHDLYHAGQIQLLKRLLRS